jgi:hypothetical protein
VDEIRLIVPPQRDFFPVVRLVVSGIGSRLELTVDRMEDLELALDSLFDRVGADADLTIALRVGNGALETEVGPFGDQVRQELAGDGEGMTLNRILGALVDDVSVGERGGQHWITLTKRTG